MAAGDVLDVDLQDADFESADEGDRKFLLLFYIGIQPFCVKKIIHFFLPVYHKLLYIY